eukprot:4201013-Pyramimonas_sp.AAC.1
MPEFSVVDFAKLLRGSREGKALWTCISESPQFRGFSVEEVSALVQFVEVLDLRRDGVLLSKGIRATFIAVLVSGSLDVSYEHSEQVTHIQPGDIIADVLWITNEKSVVTIKAGFHGASVMLIPLEHMEAIGKVHSFVPSRLHQVCGFSGAVKLHKIGINARGAETMGKANRVS